LLTKAIAQEEKLSMAEPEKDLLDLAGMDEHTARLLAAAGIKTREELAEQAVDDLMPIEGMTEDRAKTLIMTAREIWFQGESK
jgi:transcription termination/antitermination protein NusA